ncbi:MAG: DNA-binding response regulator [Sphingomonas sp. 66-10]|nr:MAG: DNA-binding response regulator [Sphingomonas sp. 66-10]
MTRILVVEDDASLARALTNMLSAEGYAVDQVGSGEAALEVLQLEPYGAVVLDIGLPDMSGFDLLSAFRRQGGVAPVLVLTARDAIADRVRGLDQGADDYLSKPFDGTELLARLRALIRRGAGDANPQLVVGTLICDPTAQTADVGGRRLNLPRREWAVLLHLAINSGKVVPKDRLAAQVFSFDDEVGPNALEVYVTRLRKKLAPDGPTIRNLRGLGYMLGP